MKISERLSVLEAQAASLGVWANEGMTLNGNVLSAWPEQIQDAGFWYPWRITAWENVSSAGVADGVLLQMFAGFVNGRPAQVAQVDNTKTPPKVSRVDLTEDPIITLYGAGFVDAAQLGVNAFFQELGVTPKGNSDSVITSIVTGTGDGTVSQSTGLPLLSQDLVLSVQKVAVGAEGEDIGDTVSYSIVTGGATVDVRENLARVVTRGRFHPPSNSSDDPAAMLEQTLADEILLARIYLLGSEPGGSQNSVYDPDATYSIWVENFVYWNLGYTPFQLYANINGVTINPKLGFVDVLSATSEVNRLTKLMSTPFGGAKVANLGYFWTL